MPIGEPGFWGVTCEHENDMPPVASEWCQAQANLSRCVRHRSRDRSVIHHTVDGLNFLRQPHSKVLGSPAESCRSILRARAAAFWKAAIDTSNHLW